MLYQTVRTRGSYQHNVRNNNGLTIETLQKNIPSIFAQEPHVSCSQKYIYIPTINILKGMINEGFIPVQAMQAKPRSTDRLEYAKHLIRFRKFNELGLSNPETSEIILVNSHDRSSSYHLMNGVFRTVCSNGLISGDLENNFKVRHSGNIIGEVIEAAYQIVGYSEETMNSLQKMKQIQLLPQERLLLAEYALKARYNISDEDEDETTEATAEKELPIPASKLLSIRRMEDNKQDLFTTMNVIQENVMKGGVSARDKNNKKHTLRQINGIDQTVKVNKLIWSFADELKKIHQPMLTF